MWGGLNKLLSQKVKTSQQVSFLLPDSWLLSNIEHDLRIWSLPTQNQIRQALDSILVDIFFFWTEVHHCETTEGDSQSSTLYQILVYSDSKQK